MKSTYIGVDEIMLLHIYMWRLCIRVRDEGDDIKNGQAICGGCGLEPNEQMKAYGKKCVYRPYITGAGIEGIICTLYLITLICLICM